jgi:hypothetical protein
MLSVIGRDGKLLSIGFSWTVEQIAGINPLNYPPSSLETTNDTAARLRVEQPGLSEPGLISKRNPK